MAVGLLFIEMGIPLSLSLKEKRSRLKPLIHRLRKEFNISVCEYAHQDDTDSTVIGCSMISDSKIFIEKEFSKIVDFIPRNFNDFEIYAHSKEYV
jgi:uncharacterized protein